MAQEQGYKVRGMAPTGAASKVLARETGIATDTVSMFQIKERQLQKDIAFDKQNAPDFQRKAELWIVDESSFLSQRQKVQIDHMAEKAGAKVVYLGDTLQLQGVEAGKPFELAHRNGMETAYMTEINRQKTADLKGAVDIITGRDNLREGQRLSRVVLNNNARAFEYKGADGKKIEMLLDQLPEVYAEHETKEQELRDFLGKDVAILRDRTGGTTRPLTLREFRGRVEASAPIADDEIGGCACFVQSDLFAD